mmetsp:Transcript_37196/g.77914  ORF Transcript_37196/g.77914 Transcript_37196/m.77914 type:complete len:439 (-) Transcript_37196:122-1438(-)
MLSMDSEHDLVEDNNEGKPLIASDLLSPTPIVSKEPIPIGGRKHEDDISSVASYGSIDSVESQAAEKTGDSIYSEFQPKTEDSSELRQQLFDATKHLVKEGEKNVSLALELEKYKDGLAMLEKDMYAFRSVLLRGINGGVADSNNYTHVGLDELLRLRIQEASVSNQSTNFDDAPLQLQQSGLARNESSVGVIQALEHKLGAEANTNEALEAKCISLKCELEATAKHMEGVENLRLKVSQMVQRLRTEREVKSKFQKDLSTEKSKVEALSDHIEKLMVHLKHEAIAKARSLADQSRLQREMEMMRTRNSVMTKKNERKDQVIAEMRESGTLLENQLRLMDEKYMELRSKLDWTRFQTERIVKKKEEEVKQLRMKFSMISDQQILLDDFKGETAATKTPAVKPPRRASSSKPVLEGRNSVIELNRAMKRALQKENNRTR